MLDQATRLREIAEHHCERPSGNKPYVITVTSGKGGVGKSTIALNLALRLAELGNNTLLFDADENLATLDVMAGVSPQWRLGDVLRGERDIQDALVSPFEHFSLLAGSSGDPNYVRMSVEQQREFLRDVADLDERFDYLVIDAPAGIGNDVLGFAIRSHETIVVTIPEPTAIIDAYAIIKMISLTDALVPLKLIVNRVGNSDEADDTALKVQEAVRHFLERPVHYLGAIPFDANASKAIMRHSPLVKEFPFSGASLALQLIAETLCEQTATTRARRFQSA